MYIQSYIITACDAVSHVSQIVPQQPWVQYLALKHQLHALTSNLDWFLQMKRRFDGLIKLYKAYIQSYIITACDAVSHVSQVVPQQPWVQYLALKHQLHALTSNLDGFLQMKQHFDCLIELYNFVIDHFIITLLHAVYIVPAVMGNFFPLSMEIVLA